MLYTLGCWCRGVTQIPYSDVEKDLIRLLNEFGPPRRTPHPEQPFWRLQRDGFWVVTGVRTSFTNHYDRVPPKAELRQKGVRGQFTQDFQDALRNNRNLVAEIARMLLANHFPHSLHQDILNAVDLAIDDTGAGGGRATRGFATRC